jgi:hypothetical protein
VPVSAEIDDTPARPGLPSILIAMPSSSEFANVRRGFVGEVQKHFNVSTLMVSRDTPVETIAEAIERTKPVCAVLMNNATLQLFERYESAHMDKAPLPVVVVMASFLDEIRGRLRRATGISYEIPAVTAFVNLRSILDMRIRRVGVVYRSMFKGFIQRQKGPAAREHLTIVGREIGNHFSAEELQTALHRLITQDKVDALWMMNDNLLVRNSEFLAATWRTELQDTKLPLVVGVSNLVDPTTSLGTLAVVPDHEALGLQAGNLVFDLAEENWQAEHQAIELPLSVKTIVDLRQVRALFPLRPDGLSHIDKVLE